MVNRTSSSLSADCALLPIWPCGHPRHPRHRAAWPWHHALPHVGLGKRVPGARARQVIRQKASRRVRGTRAAGTSAQLFLGHARARWLCATHHHRHPVRTKFESRRQILNDLRRGLSALLHVLHQLHQSWEVVRLCVIHRHDLLEELIHATIALVVLGAQHAFILFGGPNISLKNLLDSCGMLRGIMNNKG